MENGHAVARLLQAAGASPTTRLLNTLVALFGAILAGYVVVRMKSVNPGQGELKGMGWFTGKFAFPLLVFRTVATAQLGAVDPGTILACTAGKCTVMAATFLLTYYGYQADRGPGQRFLTATVFGFYTVASNDFAVAFPVVTALYGATQDMSIYITANALVGSVFFVPLSMVMFAVGESMRSAEAQSSTNEVELASVAAEGQEEASEPSQEDPNSPAQPAPAPSARISKLELTLKVGYDILTNPVIVSAMAGFLFKAFAGAGNGLPSPLGDVVTLFTAPFGMLALFLTGTSLRSPNLAAWPVMLVLMKVLVCAFVSGGLGLLLASGPNSLTLRDFSFFYGAIPSSSAPLLFAQQFDPAAAEAMASAVMYGMVLGGPVMYMTALFLDPNASSPSFIRTIQSVQVTASLVSLLSGVAYLALFALMGKEFCQQCSSKRLLVLLGFTLLAKQLVVLLMSQAVGGTAPCQSYLTNPWSPWGLVVCWLQNSAKLMILLLFVCMVFLWERASQTSGPSSYGPWAIAFSAAGICFLLALIPAVVTDPATLNQVCWMTASTPCPMQLRPDLCWSIIQVGLVLALTARRVFTKAQPQGQEPEKESAMRPDAGDQPCRDCPATALGGSSACASTAPEITHDEAAPSDAADPASGGNWACALPSMQVKILSSSLGLQVLSQVVNTMKALAGEHSTPTGVRGGFAQTLALENILEHGYVAIFLAALLADEHFALHISQTLPRLWPALFAKGEGRGLRRGLDINAVNMAEPLMEQGAARENE